MTRRISVVLDLDSGRFTAGMAAAAGGVSTLNINLNQSQAALSRVESRMHGLLETTRDFTVILGQARTALYNLRVVATGWIEAVVRTNAEMERMTFLLANMSDSLTIEGRFRDAADSLDYLFQKAKEAPFSVNALTDSFVKMKSAGIDPTKGALDGLTNAVAAFGGTDQSLHRASIAIQQMSGKGVISMEELRQQLGEAVPSAVALMARAMDLSYGELVDRVSKGQVEASSALQKLFGEFNRTFGGSSQAMMDTFAGKVSVAKTSLIELALAIGGFDRESGGFKEGSFMALLNEQLQNFIDLLQTPEVAAFAARTGEALVATFNFVSQVIGVFVKYREVIIAAGTALLTYFAARTVIATFIGMSGAVAGVTAAFANFSAGIRMAASNLALFNIAQTLYSQGAATGTERTRAFVQAAGGLGRAFALMAGPIGIAISLILAAANAMGVFEDKTKKATQAANDFARGIATSEGFAVLADQAAKARDAVADTEESLAGVERALSRTRGTNREAGYLVEKRFLEERLAKQKADLAAVEKTLSEYSLQLKEESSERLVRKVDRLVSRETSSIRRAIDAQQKELDKARDEIRGREGISEEQREAELASIRERRLALVKQQYDQEIAVLDKYISAIEQQQKRLAAGESNAGPIKFSGITDAKEQARQLSEILAKLTEQRVNLAATNASEFDIASSGNKFFAGVNSGLDTVGAQADPVGNLIDSLSKRNAGLQAELNDTGKEIAKVDEQIRIWGENGVAVTAEQAQAMRDYANAIDAANIKIRQNREDEQSMGRLSDQLERQTTTARELSAVLAGGYTEIEAEAAIFKIRLDQIVEGLHEGKEAAALMAQETADLFAQNRASEFLINLKRATQDINTSLLTGNEAAQARHDADIARIYEIIDLSKLSAEERMRAEAIVNDYISARGEQLKLETEGRFRGMLREWTETTAAMDQAAANWMDSFVDALVEGEFSFSKFAKAILADIAKIILRAVIANAIVSAIGSFGGFGGGGAVTGPGGAFPTIGQANAAFPTAHTGGVVGQNVGFSKSVSAAIFASAKRFHKGGLVGLKSDEVPTILQTGERVLDRSEARAYGRGGGAMNVQVNIINEGGEKMQEKSRSQRFDGDSYIIDIVTAAAGQPGKMRTAIKEAARSS